MPGHNPWRKVGDDVRGVAGFAGRILKWRVMGEKRCAHDKVKYICVECNPCPHGKLKNSCAVCSRRPHGKREDKFAACKAQRNE